MDFMKKMKRSIGKRVKRKKTKKKRKKRVFFGWCNPCCVIPILILLGLGIFFVGNNIDWFNGEDGAELDFDWIIPPGDSGSVFDDGDAVDEEETYYQLGLEFPIRNEDIDVLMVAELNTSDHLTFIENINLGPIGLYKSSNDYKPADMFFLSMFYGDAEYNISFSTVITVGNEQDITVYWNGVAIDEVINVTWIADGSGVRWDYP